jgi:hypothetical protein
MIFSIGEIVFRIDGNEKLYVIVVAALFAYTLKVVLKHGNEIEVILKAGKEYLLARG